MIQVSTTFVNVSLSYEEEKRGSNLQIVCIPFFEIVLYITKKEGYSGARVMCCTL